MRWWDRLLRWEAVRIVAWAMPRMSAAALREGFDRAYRHRDEVWRQGVWRDAAERTASKAGHG